MLFDLLGPDRLIPLIGLREERERVVSQALMAPGGLARKAERRKASASPSCTKAADRNRVRGASPGMD